MAWLVRFLLRVAVRRWPERLRAEVGPEWAAEAHVIEGGGARLAFAASLAVARPPREGARGEGLRLGLRGVWRPGLLMLFAPMLGVFGEIGMYVALFASVVFHGSPLTYDILHYVMFLLFALLAVGLGVLVGREPRAGSSAVSGVGSSAVSGVRSSPVSGVGSSAEWRRGAMVGPLVCLVVLVVATAGLLGAIDALDNNDPGRQVRVLHSVCAWGLGLIVTSVVLFWLGGRRRTRAGLGAHVGVSAGAHAHAGGHVGVGADANAGAHAGANANTGVGAGGRAGARGRAGTTGFWTGVAPVAVAMFGGLLSLYLAAGVQVVERFGSAAPWSLVLWWLPGTLGGVHLGPELSAWVVSDSVPTYFDRMSYILPFVTVFAVSYALQCSRRPAPVPVGAPGRGDRDSPVWPR